MQLLKHYFFQSTALVLVWFILFIGLGVFAKGIIAVRSEIIGFEGTTFPRVIINKQETLRQIDARPPKRITSVVLAADEILSLLAPERLVAVTHLVDDLGISNCSQRVPKSAKRIRSDIETVLATEPDMVFAAGYTPFETIQLLVSANIPVVLFFQHGSFADIMRNVLVAGAAIGEEDRAREIVTDMKTQILSVERVASPLTRPRVLHYSSYGYTSGKNTLIDEMIERAGGINVAQLVGLKGPAQLSLETAVSLQPEVIVVSAWEVGVGKMGAIQEFISNPVWKDVPAIRTGRICAIRGAWLTTVSPFAVTGLKEIARCIHPEVFKQ